MRIVGQTVEHKVFGQGKIIDCSEHIVVISFPQGDKKFIYPDAFAKFLTLEDKAAQKEVKALCDKQQKEEAKRKQIQRKDQERRQRLRAFKVTPVSQAAFHIDPSEVSEIFANDAVATGAYLSGKSKGEPRIPTKLKPNSAILLTGYPPSATEKDRRLLGVLMVQDDFWGSECLDGQVALHEKYRMRLKANDNLLYWNYFEGSDPLPRWGNPIFKYFPNLTMQKILYDIKKAYENTDQEALTDEFYQYFCEVNRLTPYTR